MRRLNSGPPLHGRNPTTSTRPPVGKSKREHLQGRGLAGTIRAQERHDLPSVDGEAHLTHRVDIPVARPHQREQRALEAGVPHLDLEGLDRKSTRLNSSHSQISYAVFCLKKK